MKRIKQLSNELANQIAAGEVVERPASVIKELVENSIDAGSGRIEVETEMGGRRLMKVIDDGEGIHEDDAELVFSRHATSKIELFEELESVESLGFRGEALASIASVSRFELTTKTKDAEIAIRVIHDIENGIKVEPAARPQGTTIEIRDLFFNTPARRKFLRSQPTENFHISSIVTHYALANPSIAFKLTNNGREKFNLSRVNSLRERAYQLFGQDLIESLVPVQSEEDGFVKISGFVSAPRERRTSRDSQYLFVNGRFVKDKVISSGISEGFRSVLPHGVYPVAFLFVEVLPEEVDVNVHPSKTEVRFRRAEAVKEAISSAIRESLSGAGIGQRARAAMSKSVEPKGLSTDPFDLRERNVGEAGSTSLFHTPTAENRAVLQDSYEQQTPSIPEINDYRDYETDTAAPTTPRGYSELPPVDDALRATKEVGLEDVDADTIVPMGQLHRSYIVAADKDGLLLIDQHVAHERILFDQFRSREFARKQEPQRLLIPQTLELFPAQIEIFERIVETVSEFGFELMQLSGGTIAVQAVPTDLTETDAANLVRELIERCEDLNVGNADLSIRDDIAATLACKAAVKVNMDLTPEKMRWMVDSLLITDSPTTCPHGRPVILRLTMRDIERRFHRT